MRSGRGAERGQVFLSLRPLPVQDQSHLPCTLISTPLSLISPHALPYFTFNLLPTAVSEQPGILPGILRYSLPTFGPFP